MTLSSALFALLFASSADARSAVHASSFSAQDLPAKGNISDSVVAFVGGTVIDGNGDPPLPNATVVIVGDRIAAIGPSVNTAVPPDAWRIDVRGKYLTPGFINTNVHVTPLRVSDVGFGLFNADSVAAQTRVALELAHDFLRHGVTTIRDTYGNLRPLLAARDSLLHGRAIGARLLVAGNMIGLGADGDERTQGVGRRLTELGPDSLRVAIDRYLDRGVDFIKIAVTDHDSPGPEPRLFTPQALQVIVDAAHARGKRVDVHAARPDTYQIAMAAGVDVLQHPQGFVYDSVADHPSMPEDFRRQLATGRFVCAIFASWYLRPSDEINWESRMAVNDSALVRNGCRVAVATDAEKASETLSDIVALVGLGLTPMAALTAATRTGAIAAGAERDYGTLEVGKRADLVVLGADPLADIRHVREVELVAHDGYLIDSSGQKLQRPPSTSVAP